MADIVVFLQNAWSPVFAGGTWPRESWLRALQASRSGQRLRVLLDDFNVCENTTPIVGATPDSVIPADKYHILSVLMARSPSVVVCCGKQAETALLPLWDGALLAIPHPAHRLLTDDLYRQARGLLDAGLTDRVALRQAKGGVVYEVLAGIELAITQNERLAAQRAERIAEHVRIFRRVDFGTGAE